MTEMNLCAENLHEVKSNGQRLLFHVPTSSLFALDATGGAVLDLLRTRPVASAEDVCQDLPDLPPQAVGDVLDEFRQLDLVRPAGTAPRVFQGEADPVRLADMPIDTLVLNLTSECNLACTYCYKEDLSSVAAGTRMDVKVAVAAIDWLFGQPDLPERLNVVFFGGEPLVSRSVLVSVVAYARRRAATANRHIHFSLTTNGTLLTEEVIDFLVANRVGVTVSMDGPPELHDRRRVTVSGKGTYRSVAANVRRLLDRQVLQPVGARVTLTTGVTDVVGIFRHLTEEVGFAEVGFAPATADVPAAFGLDGAGMEEVMAGLEELGELFQEEAVQGRRLGFTNMLQLLRNLRHGSRKLVPCGAGVSMLAVDTDGTFRLCHRFCGSGAGGFGGVDGGLDRPALVEHFERVVHRNSRACAQCCIRNLCAGGCYHESHVRCGDLLQPTFHACSILYRWVNFGLRAYARIEMENPAFFKKHIEPLREA